MELRPYQIKAIEDIRFSLRGGDKALCVLATGGGKSVILAGLLREVPVRALVLVNKARLVKQLAKTISSFGVNTSKYCALLDEKDLTGQCVVGTPQSLEKVAELPEFELIVVDECHRAEKQIGRILARFPKAKKLGFTATPFTPTRYIYPEPWPKPCFYLGINDLTEMGMLVEARLYGSDESFDLSNIETSMGDYVLNQLEERVLDISKIHLQVKDALPRVRERKKVVWACVSIAHAKLVQKEIIAQGEDAAIVVSDDDERDEEIDRFEETDCRHLVFVSIVAEGYDFASVDCLVLMRPTKSPVLWIQMVGRTLRLAPNKDHALILDYGNVVVNCGPLDRPYIRYSKKGKNKTSLKENFSHEDTLVIQCTGCGAFIISKIGEEIKCNMCSRVLTDEELTSGAIKSVGLKPVTKGELYESLSPLVLAVGIGECPKERKIGFKFYYKKFGVEKFYIEEFFYKDLLAEQPTVMQMGKIRAFKAKMRDWFGLNTEGRSARKIIEDATMIDELAKTMPMKIEKRHGVVMLSDELVGFKYKPYYSSTTLEDHNKAIENVFFGGPRSEQTGFGF